MGGGNVSLDVTVDDKGGKIREIRKTMNGSMDGPMPSTDQEIQDYYEQNLKTT